MDLFDVFESSNSNSRSHIDDERTIKRARISGSIDGPDIPTQTSEIVPETVFRVHTEHSTSVTGTGETITTVCNIYYTFI